LTLDGIPPGTIRSNLGFSNISEGQWCGIFDHKYVTDKSGEEYCRVCFRTKEEINGEAKREAEKQS
jgi:hypothetical protein